MTDYYIGQMSGTSLDGVDSVLMEITPRGSTLIASHHIDYPDLLKEEALALCQSSDNELHRSQLFSNELADLYALSARTLLENSKLEASDIHAIGAHGQTVRHMPPSYTVQLINAARLAEKTSITVVTDFRSRDLAANGQGAPLVPAFHKHFFHTTGQTQVVVNIGGMANISILHGDGRVEGYDTGPGNVLLDAWYNRHCDGIYDDNGRWSETGNTVPQLLAVLEQEPYFSQPAPKSTGRELFNNQWLAPFNPSAYAPEDVQATLVRLTARSICSEIQKIQNNQKVIICGGGARNGALVQEIKKELAGIQVCICDELGFDPQSIEALAFAWLAHQCLDRKTGNIPSVTGARGSRVLGAIYPR